MSKSDGVTWPRTTETSNVKSWGAMTSHSPTAYALAIAFGLLDDPVLRGHAGDRLAGLVLADNARITTGFVGTPLICDALPDIGHLDVAYRLLTQAECLSWPYTVTRGATTICYRDALALVVDVDQEAERRVRDAPRPGVRSTNCGRSPARRSPSRASRAPSLDCDHAGQPLWRVASIVADQQR